MKTYIKPSTDFHQIELSSMIAATGEGPGIKEGNVSDNNDVLGKDYRFGGSDSLWESDEEE